MRSRRERVYFASLTFATLAFAACAAGALAWGDGAEFDVRVVRWVHRTAPDALVAVMKALTYLGSGVFLGLVALGAAIALVRRGLPATAAFVATAFVASELVDQALKAAFRRARPELENPFLRLTTYSFPSGHAFAATATYGALAIVIATTVPRAHRATVFACAAVVIATVAASRVILGVHYLFDVLAGVAGGIALLSLLLLVFSDRGRGGARKQQAERVGLDA